MVALEEMLNSFDIVRTRGVEAEGTCSDQRRKMRLQSDCWVFSRPPSKKCAESRVVVVGNSEEKTTLGCRKKLNVDRAGVMDRGEAQLRVASLQRGVVGMQRKH